MNAPRALWPKTLRRRGILYRVHEGRPEWRDDDANAWHPVPLVSLAVVAEPSDPIWLWLNAHGIEHPERTDANANGDDNGMVEG